MNHFIAYHSTEKMGYEFVPTREFHVLSRKPESFLRSAIGGRVWTITGTPDSAGYIVYRLAGVFTPIDVRHNGDGFDIIGNGMPFHPAIDVTSRDWFVELRDEQNNFRFGFNRIRSEGIVIALEGASAEYEQVFVSKRAILSDLSVYTIKHSNDLRATFENGGRGTYTERRRWVRAKQLLDEANRTGNRLPIIFAPAEATFDLFAWALLDEITMTETTCYTFSHLRLFAPQPRKSTLRKASDGQALDDRFIFPYAICVTPSYLQGELGPSAEPIIGEETLEPGTFPEGAVRRISVNAYERNAEARRICLAHYGAQCIACDVRFAEVYGSVAEDFIHVHHLRQLSSVGSDYQVDAIADLRPVCPNCHAVIHLRMPPYTIEEIREMISQTEIAEYGATRDPDHKVDHRARILDNPSSRVCEYEAVSLLGKTIQQDE